MLFPYRTTQYFMKTAPYAARALSQLAGKAVSDFVSIVVSNSNGDNYSWKTNTNKDFRINYELSSLIRTISAEGYTSTHYTGHDLHPIPYQISDLREDNFVEIMVRNEQTTNSYIFSENYLPFPISRLTAQANGLVNHVIAAALTSEIGTFIYTKNDNPSNPILLGEPINYSEEF